jgi:hypothetical protein
MGEQERTSEAEPLSRLGSYDIKRSDGPNPLGATASGEALSLWWRELIEYCVGTREQRRAAAKDVDAAWANGTSASSVIQWRYGMKIEIKSAEAVADLLHGIIAPGAPFLCDDRCPHVRAGASAAQLKRFLDSLDVEIANLRRRWRECSWDHPCYEDLQDEFGIYERWRKRLIELAQVP